MKPEIIKPETSDLREQVKRAAGNMKENRDILQRINQMQIEVSTGNIDQEGIIDLLKDCYNVIINVKQNIQVNETPPKNY